ncbi:MAG: hypothetical protein L3J33_11485 [Rhodobacteraceae bacterium]|nr:hypothetical protein [Paracoccaceae bacterium]
MEEPYKNADDMPISDILTEIRQLVSDETNKRYSADRELAVTELLVLRPEARVDLALKDAEIPAPPAAPVVPPKPNIVEETLGVGSKEALRDLIREVFIEEFDRWSES